MFVKYTNGSDSIFLDENDSRRMREYERKGYSIVLADKSGAAKFYEYPPIAGMRHEMHFAENSGLNAIALAKKKAEQAKAVVTSVANDTTVKNIAGIISSVPNAKK